MCVVLVLGTGQCGSSAVAGALHHLGVWMGDAFTDVRDYPTWEDVEMAEAVESIISVGDPVDRIKAGMEENPFVSLMRGREEREPWGFKYPRLVWVIWWLLPLLDDVRLIVVERDRDATVASCRRVYGFEQERAEEWYECVADEIRAVRACWDGPTLTVLYEMLLDHPWLEVERLARFALGGRVDPGKVRAAVRSIYPGDRLVTTGTRIRDDRQGNCHQANGGVQ